MLIADYDPRWPELYVEEAERIRSALGQRLIAIEHVGSTSVPGLAAKPVIDILITVADSSDEAAYVPALNAAGYELRIREPEWYEHRMFNGPGVAVNVHVFTTGCEEIERVLMFRDWLRANAADRELYSRTKIALAQREWRGVQDYADAKTPIVQEIMKRAHKNRIQHQRVY